MTYLLRSITIKNIINNKIYSDKFLINVLDLNHPELATEEDITCGLQYWAQLFKAKTWEDLHMLASEYEVFENITDTVEQALADKKIRMECEDRNIDLGWNNLGNIFR